MLEAYFAVPLSDNKAKQLVGKSKQRHAACSFVGFNQSLLVMIHYFSLTTNQHQLDLSSQKPNQGADGEQN